MRIWLIFNLKRENQVVEKKLVHFLLTYVEFFYIWALGLLSVFIFVEDSVQCLVCVVLTFFAVEPTCSRFMFLFFSTGASIANFGIRVFDIIALMVLILILVVLSLFFHRF